MNLAIASASSPGAATALPPARAPLSASVQRRLEGYSYDGSYYYYSYGGNSCARGCPEEWRDDGVCDAACNVVAHLSRLAQQYDAEDETARRAKKARDALEETPSFGAPNAFHAT